MSTSKAPDNSLIQLLRLFDNLPLILPPRLRRPILLNLITKIRRRDPHLGSLPQPELRIIKQLHRQIHTFCPEKHNERIAFKVAGVVGVEFYPRFAAINFFGYDAAAREDGLEFGSGGGKGKGGYVDGGVFALTGLGSGFGFLCCSSATGVLAR